MTNTWQRLRKAGDGLRRHGDATARQDAWLRDCLERNRATDYGRRYGFGLIRSVDEFRDRVPLISYKEVAPWIERVANGEADVLFKGHPVAFECTGGSTGGNKLVPYSEASLEHFRFAILPWLADVIATYALGRGCAYWAISPAARRREKTPCGIQVGLPDGAYLGRDSLRAFVETSAAPQWVGVITDVADWQMATLYFLVRRNDLELISVWSPTFLLTLLEELERRFDAFAMLLSRGDLISGRNLPPDSAALSRLLAYGMNREASSLWPKLKLVSCWADASSKPFFDELKARLSHTQFQGKGLLATEGVVTVPNREGRPVLAADSGFFEFFDVNGHSRLAHELAPNERYEVVMTTSGGLYRYRTGDCVMCEGFAENLPVLRFVGRSGLTCDLVGEKLTEEFVATCLQQIPGFCMLVPVAGSRPRYALVVDESSAIQAESLMAVTEQSLSRNPQYAYARRMGQLDHLSVHTATAPLETYMKRAVRTGIRLGDVKVPALRGEMDWLDTFRGSGT